MNTGRWLGWAALAGGIFWWARTRNASATPGTASVAPTPTPGNASGNVIERGGASWYGPGYEGHPTANGESFDPSAMTAAHKHLPFGTRVMVTDTTTRKSVIVRINDRGPFVAGRIIDLSAAAADALGSRARGVVDVELRLL